MKRIVVIGASSSSNSINRKLANYAAKSISVESKIPEIEQVLSAGAVAQNILNAAHALGYGAIWRTGEMAYDDRVKTGLGLARPDKIVGFIYVGQIDGKAKDLPAVDERDIVDYW